MKKLPLILLFCLIGSTFIKAQTNRNNFIFGVSSTYSLYGTGSDPMTLSISSVNYKSDDEDFNEPDADKKTSFNFLPKVGIFVINNLAVGIDLSIAYALHDDGSNYKYTTTFTGVGPFIKYYIPTKSVRPFIEVTGSIGRITQKFKDEEDSDYDSEDQLGTTSFGINGGIAIPLGTRATFDLSAGYTSLTLKETEDNDDNYRTVIGTLGLKFGFVIFLGNN